MPPPELVTELAAKVEFARFNVPLTMNMASPNWAEPPVNVEFVTVNVPSLYMPPPKIAAELAEKVEFVTVTAPSL